jgi:hypothetical protein
LVPQSTAAQTFGSHNRCYDGVVVDSESVAASPAEAEEGTPITVAPGEKHDLIFTLTPE